MRRNTKPITIKDFECRPGRGAANDIELTSRDLAAVRKGLREPRGNPNVRQKSAEGRKQRKKDPDCESPNGIRKDLMAGKIRTQIS